MLIREVKIEDLNNLTWDEFLKQIKNTIKDDINKSLENKIIYLISETDNKISGQIQANISNSPQAYIYGLRVKPEFQHQGIGTKLMNEIEDRLNTLGYKKFIIHVNTKNKLAQKMYEKFGYKVTGNPKLDSWDYVNEKGIKEIFSEEIYQMIKEV